MSEPLISVIVPVYNVGEYLNRCIESIVTQTYTKLEIILVDDGSSDDCPELCDLWAEKDARIKVIHKQNGGLSDARNKGMALATGEYISFIDSDDWIASEFYERLYTAIKQDGSDLAACTVCMVWEDGSPEKLLTVRENLVLNRNQAQLALLEETKLKQPVWYKLYKTDLIKDIPFEFGKYHEDVFWSYQAIGKAKSVSLIDYIGYFYWQRKGSIMSDGFSLKRLDALEALKKRIMYIKTNFHDLQSKALIALWESCIYNGQMSLKYLESEDISCAFKVLKSAMQEYPICYYDYKNMKISHRIWLILSKVSLKGTCKLKNILNIGL